MTPPGAYTSRCRTCGREIAAEAASCPRCGAVNLEERCPHCGAVTTTSSDKELRSRCDLCGGPRIPRGDPKVKRVRRELTHLKRANEARKARAKFRAISAVFGAVGAFSTFIALIAAWLLPFSVISVGVAWAVFAMPALALVVWATSRASAKSKEIAPAIDQAWVAAAGEVAARLKAPFNAGTLAETMGIEEHQAEELLAQLDANDVVRSDVTEAGEIAYQPKFRVAATPAGDGGEAEREALAEAEALAAGEPGARAAK